MNVQVSTHHFEEAEDIRRHAERRVAFALGRFGNRISRIRVRIADVNGPKGGVDARCSLRVHVPHQTPIVITETAIDPGWAVELATERAARAVDRRLGRRGSRRRSTLRAA